MISTKEETFNANILSNIGDILSGPVDLRGSNDDRCDSRPCRWTFMSGLLLYIVGLRQGRYQHIDDRVTFWRSDGNAGRDRIVCGILDTVDAVGLSFPLIYMGKMLTI